MSGREEDIPALDAERDRIVRAITFALDLPDAWPHTYDLVKLFAPYMERRGAWDVWNQLLERAIAAAQQVGDIPAVITLSALLARLLQRQDRPREAISQYRRVIKLARQTQNRYETGRACTNLGYLYIEQGYWYRAEVLCCQALAIFESLGSQHGQAHTENHLGLLYTNTGAWTKGRRHLERACTLWEAMGDRHGLMRGLINRGVLGCESGQPDEALTALKQALEQARLTGEEAEVGRIYLNMGDACWLKGDLEQAEAYTWQAEAVFKRFFNREELARVWANLGLIYLDQEKWTDARHYLDLSLATRRQIGHEQGELASLLHLVKYELIRGDWPASRQRLQEVESRLERHQQSPLYRRLQFLLAQHRDLLAEISSQASEAGKTSETQTPTAG